MAEVPDRRVADIGQRQRDVLTFAGLPRRRTAARIPVAAVSPVITSQAGNTWFTGASGRAGPVTIGNPTALFTV